MTKRHKYVIKSEMGGAGGSLKFPADVLAEWNISADRVPPSGSFIFCLFTGSQLKLILVLRCSSIF